MRSHFGLKICWRLAEDRFRGYLVKYHVAYHYGVFWDGKFKYWVFNVFELYEVTFWPQNLLEAG